MQVSHFVQMGLGLMITAILARLLTPADFGLIGIVSVCVNFITLFTSIGFGTAIIQKQDTDRIQVSTLYWLNYIFGALNTLLVFAGAGMAARFFHNPELIPLLQVFSLNFLVIPLSQVHRRLLEKNLDFKLISIINLVAAILSGILAIWMAVIGFGAMSLVIQVLLLNLFNSIGSRLAVSFRPLFVVSMHSVRAMLRFSLQMRGAQLMRYLEKNIDMIILGKLLPTNVFGYYSLATRIVYLPIRRVTYTFTEILFPAISRIKNDISRVRKGYLRSVKIITMVVSPALIMAGFYAEPVIRVFLGVKWVPAALVVSILAASGVIQSIEQLSVSVLPAINRAGISFSLNTVRFLFTGGAAYAGGVFGLVEAATAILVVRIGLFVYGFIVLKRYLQYSTADFWKSLKSVGVASMLMALPFVFSIWMHIGKLQLIAFFALSGIIYSLVIWKVEKKELVSLFNKAKST